MMTITHPLIALATIWDHIKSGTALIVSDGVLIASNTGLVCTKVDKDIGHKAAERGQEVLQVPEAWEGRWCLVQWIRISVIYHWRGVKRLLPRFQKLGKEWDGDAAFELAVGWGKFRSTAAPPVDALFCAHMAAAWYEYSDMVVALVDAVVFQATEEMITLKKEKGEGRLLVWDTRLSEWTVVHWVSLLDHHMKHYNKIESESLNEKYSHLAGRWRIVLQFLQSHHIAYHEASVSHSTVSLKAVYREINPLPSVVITCKDLVPMHLCLRFPQSPMQPRNDKMKQKVRAIYLSLTVASHTEMSLICKRNISVITLESHLQVSLSRQFSDCWFCLDGTERWVSGEMREQAQWGGCHCKIKDFANCEVTAQGANKCISEDGIATSEPPLTAIKCRLQDKYSPCRWSNKLKKTQLVQL